MKMENARIIVKYHNAFILRVVFGLNLNPDCFRKNLNLTIPLNLKTNILQNSFD